MAQHPCSDCPEILKSEKAYNYHRLMQHDVYSNNSSLFDAAEKSLMEETERAEYILRRFPETRGDDNVFVERHKQAFEKTRVYNQDTQTWQDRNPIGSPFISHEKREYDMIRARQLIQERAKKGKPGYKWKDLMPTDMTVLRRRKLYDIYTKLFAERKIL